MPFWYFLLPLIGALIGLVVAWLGYRVFLKKFMSRSGALTGEIKKHLTNPSVNSSVMPVIETHMDDFLQTRLVRDFPMISMFVGDKTIASLKKTFMHEIETMLPNVMIKFSESLGSRLKIPLMAIGRKVLIAGTLIGFIIGVIQLLITLLVD